ncbi:MAG TPA: O-antigen ligase family protein [Bacteroidia bacterium]|nr:O-antigen ligase family protein [Bacteroidia bacterium]
MSLKKDIPLFLGITLFLFFEYYILTNKYDLFVPFNLIPFVTLLLVGIFYFTEWIIFFMVFITPFAITLRELGITQGIDLSIPTEPLMIIFSGIYLINEKLKGITAKTIFQHPVTKIIFIQLIWMFITTLTSMDIIVSAKYLTARLWFVLSSYFLMNFLFQNIENIKKFIWMYALGLSCVAIITLIKHAEYNFHHKIADWIVTPFYNDHTAYGAALALFIPPVISLVIIENKIVFKSFLIFISIILFVAVIFSFARAAWIGLFAALLVLITLLLKIKFRTLLISFVSLFIIIFSFSEELLYLMGKNKTDSEGSFYENILSTYNIKNDASNLERINRWNCAIRMFLDKPVFGFGPGTYQFFYAPYQLSKEKTIISTNFGTGGNSHSEYLGPLSEEGLPGLLIVLTLILFVFSLGYRLCYTVQNKKIKILTYGIFLGLVTYFVHGFFNNFLDTDKLSLPFWGFIAMLVSIDVYHKNNNNIKNNIHEKNNN